MKGFSRGQAGPSDRIRLLALGLVLALCLCPTVATSAASRVHHGQLPAYRAQRNRLLSRPVAVSDARAYQAAIYTVGRADSTPTTEPAPADKVELVVFHFLPSGVTEWSWTDPATGSGRVDRFARNGALVQSTITIGNRAEFIGYARKEESFSPLPEPVHPGSSIGALRRETRQQLRLAIPPWKKIGTAVVNGHTVRLYEQDGLTRLADGATGASANVASIAPESMLVYRQVLLDLRHGRRSLLSGYDYDYRVVARSRAAGALLFRFVHLAGYSAAPPLPAQHT